MADGSDKDQVENNMAEVSKAELMEENRALQKKARDATRFALALGVIALIALGAVVAILINFSISEDTPDDDALKMCGAARVGYAARRNILNEPEVPGVFHGLTVAEMRRVREFLNMSSPEDPTLRDPHIYSMDLEMPNKTAVLDFLDHGGPRPERQARVTVFRGDLTPPVVHELVCGPLENITECSEARTVPFAYRPFRFEEFRTYDGSIIAKIHEEFGDILMQSYGGSFDYVNCEEDCFNYWVVPVGSAVSGVSNVRKVWITPTYNWVYYPMYPLDFAVLANVDGVNETMFSIEQVWYAGVLYPSAEELKTAYADPARSISNTTTTYPSEGENLFSSLKPRGDAKPHLPQRPPQLVEPDGRRYTVNQGRIEYLDMWSFYYRISPVYGPALYDIRFLGERIAYEISLMELLAVYTGGNPMRSMSTYINSAFISGSRSRTLVGGTDCPNTATYLPQTVTSQTREAPEVLAKAACVFEHNFGRPLRRHHGYSWDDGAFYGGLADSALVFRSIHTIENFDGVIEFKFHQNGALGVSVLNSGYLLAEFNAAASSPYGLKITDKLVGPTYFEAAHFKVDLDVSGVTNSYQTLNITEEPIQFSGRQLSQTSLTPNQKTTELTAAYQYDFQTPKYHIFYNEDARNSVGEAKAYRLTNGAMGKFVPTVAIGNEPSHAWTRYQLAVTQRRHSEQTSSSPYAQFDSINPTVNFLDFITDDDSLENQDLVAWVTLAANKIAHSESMPNVATAGEEQSFYLTPFNYFPESPSMASRDAVFLTLKDPNNEEEGLISVKLDPPMGEAGEKATLQSTINCEFEVVNASQPFLNNPNSLVEATRSDGIF